MCINEFHVVHLVLVAGTLAVLSQALYSLVDECHVLLIDVEPQKAEAPCGTAADAVQELQRLTHQVVVILVVLAAKEVLREQGQSILCVE